MSQPVRIASCSGFYGDRLSAAAEMVAGGPVDVLTGDWLAELTMGVLAKSRARGSGEGYARTFLTQLEQVMGECLDRGIRVVSNAGGLAPRACAEAAGQLAGRLGLHPVIAYVEGDDLLPRLAELRRAGVGFEHAETGEPLRGQTVLTANAYLGGWGIAEALARGADIVITGRVTDAALTLGPAAWHHAWRRDNWDALAGAVVAGHVLECGAQATGGNYAFFREVPGLEHPGFPLAEVAADGSSVITKHPGHGGQVSVGTVTAQLLYEIGGPAYLNPDVTARFDTIELEDEGPDRVRISGVRGEPPPATAKAALTCHGGWRATVTIYLTGLEIEAKAALVERALWGAFPGGRASFGAAEVALLRTDQPDPASNEAAMAQLRITVKDADEQKVGRAFTARVTELALASCPGFFGAGVTGGPQAYGVFWPALVPAELLPQRVMVAGKQSVVEPVVAAAPKRPAVPASRGPSAQPPGGPVVRAPLGLVAGARSGDKGGNANLGVWARSDAGYAWLAGFLTVAKLRELLPETAPLAVERYEFPNLNALNFVISGLLGEGAAATSRFDPQAKSLGEWLRARLVEIPEVLLARELAAQPRAHPARAPAT
jgi:hypothetical protein